MAAVQSKAVQSRKPAKAVAKPKSLHQTNTVTDLSRHLGNQVQIGIGAANDRHEQEAGRLSRKINAGGKVSVTERVGQTREASTKISAAAPLQKKSGHGRLLPKKLKKKYSLGLDEDLSAVRIHTDRDAAEFSSALHARAVTYGDDIYFAAGQYNPNTFLGQQLLAHEVVHTVQQRDHSLLQREPDPSKDDVLEILADIEQSTDTELLEQDQTAREAVIQRLQGAGISTELAQCTVSDYQQQYNREIAELIESAQQVTEIPAGIRVLIDEFRLAVAQARERTQSRIESGSGDLAALQMQLEWLNLTEQRITHDVHQKLQAVLLTEPIQRSDLFDFIARLPIDNLDKPQAEGVLVLQKQLTGDIRAEAQFFHQPVINLSLWLGIFGSFGETAAALAEKTGQPVSQGQRAELESMTAEQRRLFLEYIEQQQNRGKDAAELLQSFRSLTPLELKILQTNALLNKRKTGAAEGDIQFTLADVRALTAAPAAMSDIDQKLHQAAQVLSQLGGDTQQNPNAPSFGLDTLRRLLNVLRIEIVMLQGMMKGASSRYPQMQSPEAEMNAAIDAKLEEIKSSISEDLAMSVLIGAIPVAGGPLSIAHKIEKITGLVENLQQLLSVSETIEQLGEVAKQAESRIAEIEALLQRLDDVDQDEIDGLIFQLIDDYGLLDYMVLPDFEGLDPVEIQQEILKIVRDIPAGLNAMGDLSDLYKETPRFASDEQLAMLSLTAIGVGLLLSPFVLYMLIKGAQALQNSDRSLMDRLTPGRRKRRRRRDRSLEDKNRKTKDQVDKARPVQYEYVSTKLQKFIEKHYAEPLKEALEDKNNSLGQHVWTEDFFKHFVRQKVDELEKDVRTQRKTVKAYIKGKRKEGLKDAPMKPLSQPKFFLRTKPWTVKLQVSRMNSTSVTVGPNATKFKELDYDSFAGTGIAYADTEMTGDNAHKPEKRQSIDNWLTGTRDSAYEFTYETDPALGNGLVGREDDDRKHIRRKGGAHTNPGLLQIDNGRIKQGIDVNVFKKFEGKKLSEPTAKRSNLDDITRLLPPGYLAQWQPMGAVQIAVKRKPHPGLVQQLSWDDGILAVGNESRQPRRVNNKQPSAAMINQDTLTTTQIDTMLDNMSEKDGSGALTGRVDGGFHDQRLDTMAKWRAKVSSTPELQQRPASMAVNLGYTVNVDRKNLDSFKLPELKRGRASDDKGHLIAARFSGADNANALDDYRNLVPMNSKVNQTGAWQDLEREMAQVYIGRGATPTDYVHLKMTLNYNNFIRRPDSIQVTWEHRSSSGRKKKTHGPTVITTGV